MKATQLLTSSFAALAIAGGTSHAASVFSMNFVSYGQTSRTDSAWSFSSPHNATVNRATVTIETGETAGVVPTDVWDNVTGATATLNGSGGETANYRRIQQRNQSAYGWLTLRDLTKDVTGGNTAYMNNGNATLLDGHMNGTQFDGPNGPVDPSRNGVFEVTNIPFTTYDAIIYIGLSQGQQYNGIGHIDFNNTGVETFTLPNSGIGGQNYRPSTTLDPIDFGGGDTTGNYIRYSNLTSDSFTARIYGDRFTHLGLAGLQIVEIDLTAIPEPSSMALLGMAGIFLFRRRRS